MVIACLMVGAGLILGGILAVAVYIDIFLYPDFIFPKE